MALQACFADDVARFQAGIGSLHLLRADFTHVANRVGQHIAVRVAAAVNHQHFEHGNVDAMRLDKCNIGWAGFRFDHDRLELRHGPGSFNLLLHILQRHAQTVGNLRQELLHLFGSIAQQQDAEGGVVVYEDAAFAIEHRAARGDDGNRPNAIAFGHLRIAIRINDLQLPETKQQQRDHPDDDVGNDGQPLSRQPFIVH